MLDSWVRYEGQVKQRQQKELAESVIAKVQKELENPKALQQILQQAVADVESKSSISHVAAETKNANLLPRDRFIQGSINVIDIYHYISFVLPIQLLCNSQLKIYRSLFRLTSVLRDVMSDRNSGPTLRKTDIPRYGVDSARIATRGTAS